MTAGEKKRTYRRFSEENRHWIISLYKNKPVLCLDEAKDRFERKFETKISLASIFRILHWILVAITLEKSIGSCRLWNRY